MFIELRVNRERCGNAPGCRECASVCPVDVFGFEGDCLVVNRENEDECTLCELCLQACPAGAIRLVKLYETKPALTAT
jgi:NAD-dependent dihydropyrimidine dehydrogenase PreA subunit